MNAMQELKISLIYNSELLENPDYPLTRDEIAGIIQETEAMRAFTRYANITPAEREAIIDQYNYYREQTTPGHAVACTAARAWELSDRQWNGKTGSDCFAATLAVLVMKKEIQLVDTKTGHIE